MARVYTGGTFDLFHSGHVDLLRVCRDLAGPTGEVIVALNTDDFVEEYKGSKPACSFNEREAVLGACRFVDDVVVNRSGSDSKPTIALVDPDYIVIGDDWATRDYYAQMGFTRSWLDERRIHLVYVARINPMSSTVTRKALSP